MNNFLSWSVVLIQFECQKKKKNFKSNFFIFCRKYWPKIEMRRNKQLFIYIFEKLHVKGTLYYTNTLLRDSRCITRSSCAFFLLFSSTFSNQLSAEKGLLLVIGFPQNPMDTKISW